VRDLQQRKVELFVGEKCSDKFCLQFDFHVIVEIFYMPQICDMWHTALLPLRRKACWGFFALKNPTASAGFEPANLGTKGQHATSRPPKHIGPNWYPWCKSFNNGRIAVFSLHYQCKRTQVDSYCLPRLLIPREKKILVTREHRAIVFRFDYSNMFSIDGPWEKREISCSFELQSSQFLLLFCRFWNTFWTHNRPNSKTYISVFLAVEIPIW
jgi:hypothetical protein